MDSIKNMQKICEICRTPYFAFLAYICTPHLADSDVDRPLSLALVPWPGQQGNFKLTD